MEIITKSAAETQALGEKVGTYLKGGGFAIGHSSDVALDVIHKGYDTNMNIEQALELSNEAIEKAIGEKPVVESGIVTSKGFTKLKQEF